MVPMHIKSLLHWFEPLLLPLGGGGADWPITSTLPGAGAGGSARDGGFLALIEMELSTKGENDLFYICKD